MTGLNTENYFLEMPNLHFIPKRISSGLISETSFCGFVAVPLQAIYRPFSKMAAENSNTLE